MSFKQNSKWNGTEVIKLELPCVVCTLNKIYTDVYCCVLILQFVIQMAQIDSDDAPHSCVVLFHAKGLFFFSHYLECFVALETDVRS